MESYLRSLPKFLRFALAAVANMHIGKNMGKPLIFAFFFVFYIKLSHVIFQT
jgi:hypothetical protein